jgi:NTE family protein
LGGAKDIISGFRRWARRSPTESGPVIGLALGGGFARGIAHLGILRVLEENEVPVAMIAGVSAGALVASAYASGTTVDEIAVIAKAMRFKDIARRTFSRLGLAGSDRMADFIARLLKVYRFEEMRIPLAVLATDLSSGRPVVFREHGSVVLPIRASCSYPGLFQPVRYRHHYLVDGAMTCEVPAPALRKMGATHIVSVCLPVNGDGYDPSNMLQVVNRCFSATLPLACFTHQRNRDCTRRLRQAGWLRGVQLLRYLSSLTFSCMT